ncbi:MAG: hypothetical protein E7167_02960 [Firmicutes bacterium]|nr:hypothetical protein [Bacillota bacterium]
MKKAFLIKNQEVFQGQKNIKKKKQYFEGWYFKNSSNNYSIAFIPGINVIDNIKEAFIQIITNNTSYFIKYNFDDFEYGYDPFYIKIGKNYFTKEFIHIDIKDSNQNIRIFGNIDYTNLHNIKSTFISPNIMGPFSYLPFMECNHAIIAMKATANGIIKFNKQTIKFINNTVYIEKDWGSSFPKTYIWCQANNFDNPKVSMMISIADIPFKLFHFVGFICILKTDSKEYKFTTYNFARIIKKKITTNQIDITLKKRNYTLHIQSFVNNSHNLSAPIKGKMTKTINESITANTYITLKKSNNLIYSGISNNCGLEIVEK